MSAVGESSSSTGQQEIIRILREFGYVDGKNIQFEFRYAQNKLDRLPALAEELVSHKVDVLITPGTPSALALRNATKTIPIVFVDVTDPVGAGLVKSLARPASNLTGFSSIESVLVGKRLELLKETVGDLSRVAVLWDPQNSALDTNGKRANARPAIWGCRAGKGGSSDQMTLRNQLLLFAFTALLLSVGSVEAQQPGKIPRIGFISPASSPTAAPNLEALRQGLRELGYIEGKSIIVEPRWAEGAAERFPHYLTELNQVGADVIVIGSAAGAIAAKNSGLPTPIIFAAVTDPLGYGIVDSLAQPGGNITGVALAVGEGFSGKWVELLKETVPKLDRSAVLRNPSHPLANVFMRETQVAARALGVKLEFIDARRRHEVSTALSRLGKERHPALIVTPDPVFTAERRRIVDAVTSHHLPSMFFSGDFVDAGGLTSYGPSFRESYRRAAFYVDKILKGFKPADLPVEQPTRFELVINLKTAKQIGLTIPQNVLARADRVIR